MSTLTAWLRAAGPRPPLLLAGDLLVLLAFTVAGRRTHAEAAGLEAIGAVLGTAAPFALAWLAATLALGAARADAPATPAALAQRTFATWTVAFPLAMLLRALALGRLSPGSFYLVAGLLPLALLLAWRLGFALVAARRARERLSRAPRPHA
jgi:hypothetical protein